jgi:endoglucanase
MKVILILLLFVLLCVVSYRTFGSHNNKKGVFPSLASGQKVYGVNLSGAEFGEQQLPGELNRDYIYPHSEERFRYFSSKKITLIRLPIRWERVQHSSYESLSTADIEQIKEVLAMADKYGMKVIIDLHNFGRYYGHPLNNNDADKFGDVWTKLAQALKDTPGLYGYELMNEPHDLPGGSDAWAKLAQRVTTAIRTVDSQSVILIPGYNWQNAQGWAENNPHLLIKDPDNNLMYASHIYFDSSYSGLYKNSFEADNRHANIGVAESEDFKSWLKIHNARGIFTEYGVPADPQWLTAMNIFLKDIQADTSIVGSIYWSAGPWWRDYPLSIEPKGGIDQEQMKVISRHAK